MQLVQSTLDSLEVIGHGDDASVQGIDLELMVVEVIPDLFLIGLALDLFGQVVDIQLTPDLHHLRVPLLDLLSKGFLERLQIILH